MRFVQYYRVLKRINETDCRGSELFRAKIAKLFGRVRFIAAIDCRVNLSCLTLFNKEQLAAGKHLYYSGLKNTKK